MSKYVRKADRPNLPQGALVKHGFYANAAHQAELLGRHPEIMSYLGVVRRGFVRDLSPEGEAHMTTAKHLILDRLMRKLSMAKLIEAFLDEHGFLRQDKPGMFDVESITSLWLALNHQIRLDLQLLGLERKALDAELTVLDVIAEFDKDKAAKAAEAGKTALLRPVEGKTIEGADIVAGDSGGSSGRGE